jgi:hypothetical protein|eukprot:GDKJ01046754.1.p1 GENE.GDKJ01046754.1~~GDKJ01046754.1.p1  ORF type:complete len:240 (-),score=-14.54 GDKJ01046754.1:494-1213(-)
MRFLKIGTAIALSGVMAIACQHKANTPSPVTTGTNNNGNNTGGNNNTVDTGICFSRDILPIFIANCTQSGCHNATDRADGYQFTSYETITAKDFTKGNASETKLYKAITDNDPKDRMPQAPNAALSSGQITLIARWINEGANNKTDCGTPCDSNNYTYSAAIKPLMDKYCRGCHSGATASKNVVLDNYDGTKNAVMNGKLLQAVRGEVGVTPMPSGGAKLSSCQIVQLEKWAAAGAPNN